MYLFNKKFVGTAKKIKKIQNDHLNELTKNELVEVLSKKKNLDGQELNKIKSLSKAEIINLIKE